MTPVTPALLNAGFMGQLRAGRLRRRLPQLVAGLVLYGFSIALMVRSGLGLAPWDVLHAGLTHYLPLSLGQVLIAVSFAVLLAWIPLRERVGLGTIANAILVGASADLTLAVIAQPDAWAARVALLAAGIGLNGLATAVYVGAQLGRGPRDGLMTGLSRRTGWSLRSVRTCLELSVVAAGVALGGVAGIGTLAYAFLIGPLAQRMIPRWIVDLHEPADGAVASAAGGEQR